MQWRFHQFFFNLLRVITEANITHVKERKYVSPGLNVLSDSDIFSEKV